MAIATFAELKTAVENWLDRTNLTDRVPEFITLAETRVNRSLRVLGIETRSITSLVAGQAYYAFPSDFQEMRNIQINTNPITLLTYRTPQQLDVEYPDQSTTGTPKVYTIIGSQFQLAPIPESTDDLEIAYFKSPAVLSDSNTTNWTLTNAPDLLLYASLLEAEAFLVNDSRVPLWKAAFDEGMKEINMQAKRARHSGTALVARTDTSNP